MNVNIKCVNITITKSIKWRWTLNASIYTTIKSIKWMWTLNASIYTIIKSIKWMYKMKHV